MAEPVTTTAAASTGGSANTAAWIGAGAQTGGGILGYIGARQQRKHSLKLMQKAQQHDLSMWQKQAAYNSPEQQMQRLKDAGLNPNLVYGTGAQGATGQMNTRPETHVQNTEVTNELAQIVIPNVIDALVNQEKLKQEKEHSGTAFYERGKSKWQANQAGFDFFRDTEWYDHMGRTPGMQKKYLDLKTKDKLNQYKRSATELDIRELELQLSKELKPFGLSVNDPVGARLLLMLSSILGFDLKGQIKNLTQ